jgi:hypothetical protein
MRFFLSLLVPFFLSFACAQEEYLYSVAWEDSNYTCTEVEDSLSLDAIEIAVNGVLAANNLTEVTSWTKRGSTNNRNRELEQAETRGQRELCDSVRCETACADYTCCAEIYNCDECRRRQLIQTERALTHRELEDLQGQLVIACTAALVTEGTSNGNVNYTTECKAAMSGATCNALVYSPPSVAPHSVCENFALYAQTTVTFGGELTTIYAGDVGFSTGTSITGTPTFVDGGQVVEADAFAASMLAAHATYTAVQDGESALGIEIGSQTFTPGTYRSGSAINIAHGTTVTLDGLNQANAEFLFIAGSTLVTAADTEIILINGAKAENVLWALVTAATFGARSVVQGSILAGTAITFGTQSKLHGCALAQTFVNFESGGIIDPIHL